ncbi:MAG TPA: M10 family metallopeptidase C-terminal domain-containing protein [Accumulibacter sp.]|nr:M10 family metallopeptidase C-terminal domain-containing protein [Accumulibacter sp.]HMW16620.1 M10 family metallopeptidase C-terminal domain-containing protein [Accumulibacter sp.]HMY05486.1 M10 family metallopeptidase C-terminal domain-containing protein [Accumulibacter sp.]HND79338.1 M10 family metallopeptidase C-terminal domain-containing protein [Accumulibacter sp.]HNE12195.1 M10 family metallopeptidase C-terminal domain-containing protein [Accumulibacter sp.]
MALASWSQQQILDQLISGYSWSGSTISYAFPTSSTAIYGSQELAGFVGLNAVQQAAAERALQTWDDLIAADMVRTTASDSNIEFGTSSTGVSFAHAYFPSISSVWFSRNYAELLSPQIGQHSFMTYVHEIGHALGLDHMGNYNGSGSWTPSSYEDSGVYSVMSYFGPNMNSGSGQVAWADWVGSDGKLHSPQTPMVNDVLAIQTIYGAETTTRTGDTVYGFHSNVTGTMAAIFDFTLNTQPILTIYDAGGNDTLDLSGWNTSSTINLAPGAYSSCSSMTSNIAIAYSCDLENAVGGGGDDQLNGNLLANRLDGGAGNDIINGGGGNDLLLAGVGNDQFDGGDGQDTVQFSGAFVDYTYTYAANTGFTFFGNATGTDIIKGVEWFAFSDVTKSASQLSTAVSPTSLVSISAASAAQNEGNSGSTPFTYYVRLNTASSTVQSLNWAVSGDGASAADPATDFVGATSGTLTFQVGETEKIVQIAVRGDTAVESDEGFVVTLSSPSSGLVIGTASVTGTIRNDDVSVGGDDFGNTTNTNGVVAVNGGAVAGAIETAGDIDLFKVDLVAGTTYVFDLFKASGNLDPYLSLYPPTSTTTTVLYPQVSNDNANSSTTNAQITYTATSSGTYYLLARDSWLATGGYSLNASTLPGKTLTGDDNGNTLAGTLGDDRLYGMGGADVLDGSGGADWLDGGAGADSMSGGNGNDTYVVDDAADVVSEVSSSGGIDLVRASVSFTLAANLENLLLTGVADLNGTGNALANVLTGNSGNNLLDGKGGVDTFAGGLGNDSYVLDSEAELANVSEIAGQGNDTLIIGYTNPAEAKTVVLTGTLAEIENLVFNGGGLFDAVGNAADNVLTGNTSTNRLDGGAGNDTLDGKGGADVLLGGAGDDVYVIDQTGDQIIERLNEGIDTVRVAVTTSGMTCTLASNIENATIVSAAAVNVSGNALDNILIGNAASNRLDGAAGADRLVGGGGNDTYVVDQIGDAIVETSTLATEIDTVESSISWTLGDNLEKLLLTGSANINGNGNGLNNTLTGNSGANRLDGGLGADSLFGGAGDDIYLVDQSGDKIYETAAGSQTDAGGNDTVLSSIDWTLGNYLENLQLLGSAAINGTGNALDNALYGNSGSNVLDGKAGVDRLDGGEGADIYLIGNSGDHPAAEIADSGQSGSDEVRFASSAGSTLTLFAGDRGIERVVIGGGVGQTATETSTALNIDAAQVGNALSIQGNAGANVLIGTAFADQIAGGGGNDRLIGGAGGDTLIGGAGNDVYVVDSLDTLVETSTLTSEIDTVESAIDWTLATNFENLTLLGSAAINGTGNEANNTLLGNQGDNRLDGGLGADILLGGAGNDLYRVDNLNDKVFETTAVNSTIDAGGIDTVISSVGWTLGNFVENLQLDGIANLNGFGNDLNNTLRGNAGINVLDGRAGIDFLDGGDGADIYLITSSGDHPAAEIADSGRSGVDEIRFAATVASTLTLYAGDTGVERLVIGSGLAENAVSSSSLALNLDASQVVNGLTIRGNAGANSLIGTAFDDRLEGAAGADSLMGGAGNDLLIGGLGSDQLTGGAGADRFIFDQTPNATTNRDLVVDFQSGVDSLQLSLAVFKGLGAMPGNLSAEQFWSGNGVIAAHDASDRLIYNTATGELFYDVDGLGGAAATSVALIGALSHPTLTYSDFSLIA